MSRNKLIRIYFSLGFVLVLFLCFSFISRAQQNNSDAIAVRILPNPHHYSITRWYKEQGFKGAPQALTVDGYEAIRDGRTVYVNATNVVGTTIYTNIYLISYNQTANTQTSDVLGKIVSHWKFNNNFTAAESEGQCNIGSVPCNSDKDCTTGYKCSADSSDYRNKCVPQNDPNCSSDTDCSAGVFCSSLKAKITRDISRVSRLSELRAALDEYKLENKRFPVLEAGTFVKNKTVSTWPSWNGVLLPALGVSSINDPINSMGYCPGFEASTCWNKNNNTFFDKTPVGHLKFPSMSRVIYYSTDSNGSVYTLCAGMESPISYNTPDPNKDPFALSKFRCDDTVMNNTSAANTLPKIVDYQLNGVTGKEFNGFIKVSDAENNPLTFTFTTGVGAWASWNPSPVIQKTNNPNQIKLYSPQAGAPGNYNFTFTANDGTGTMTTTTIPIKISESQVLLEAEDITHVLRPGNNLEYSFVYTGAGGLNKTLVKESGRNLGGFLLLSSTKIGDNKYEIKMKSDKNDLVWFPGDTPFSSNTTTIYQLSVGNVTKKIKINIVVEPPILDFNCPQEARIGRPYACFIGNKNQGDHIISYVASGLPNELILDDEYTSGGVSQYDNNEKNLTANQSWFSKNFGKLFAYLGFINYKEVSAASSNTTYQPDLSGSYYIHNKVSTQLVVGTHNITIDATNEFKTPSSKSFQLKINSFCGDGTKNYPNSEGKGGYYNDGYEDCDGTQGVTTDVSQSSVSLQYSCDSNTALEYPIKNGNYCIFSSPLKGGGFRGDGICEAINLTTGAVLETPTNAREDCGTGAGGNNGTTGICGDGVINQATEVCDCDPAVTGYCDLGGKTCKDFNFWAVAPYGGLSLSCNVNNNCQSFVTSGCLYPHQSLNNSVFTCENGWKNCNNNVTDGCELQCCPSCNNKTCGPDGCDGSCGSCGTNQVCKNGQCCTRNCTNKECGSDGCGGWCGTGPNQGCSLDKVCTSNYKCRLPNCGDYEYCETGYLCCRKNPGYEFCFPHSSPNDCDGGGL